MMHVDASHALARRIVSHRVCSMLASHARVLGRTWRCRKASTAPARRLPRAGGPAGDQEGGPEEDEDETNRLQEVLVELLRAETLKVKVKDALEKCTEDEVERLRALVEEAHEEFDKLDELNKQRTQLEFGSALADIERIASEVEEQIRNSRASSQKDGKDLEAFEKDMEDQLMTGLFFKSIHRTAKNHTHDAARPSLQDVQARVKDATNRSIDSFVLRWAAYLLLAVLAGVPLVASVVHENASPVIPAVYTCVLLLMSLQMRKELGMLEKDKDS